MLRWTAVALALWASASVAASATGPVRPREQDIQRILERQDAIAKQVDHARPSLSERQKQTIRTAQKRIRAIVADKASLDALSVEQRVQLVNAQERINAAIVGTRAAEEARLVCRSGRPTGSQVRRLRCATVREDDLLREMANRDADGDLLDQ